MNYLTNARKYFDTFRDTHARDYREMMRTYRINPNNGYGFFKGDDYVTQTMINICGNLEETFATTDIPGQFTTPRSLVNSWLGFRELLRQADPKFNEIRKELLDKDRKKSNVEDNPSAILPEPFVQFDRVRREVTDVLDHILEMEEVQQYMKKAWHESSAGKIIIGVVSGIIVLTVGAYIINPHAASTQSTHAPTPPISQTANDHSTQIGTVQGNVTISTPPPIAITKKETKEKTERASSAQQITSTAGQSVNNWNAGRDINNIGVVQISQNERHSPTLQPQQEKFLELLYEYQKQFGTHKLIVSREDGRIYFDNQPGQGSAASFIKDMYGSITEHNAGLFEALIEGMPSEYVRLHSETRLDNPFVISITGEGSRYIQEHKK